VCKAVSNNAGCYPASFSVNGTYYHKICGKARGYQRYTTDAFNTKSKDINGAYVDGLSITLGKPRKHVWTYAASGTEVGPNNGCCPCAALPGLAPHAFIGDHYYCESGFAGVGSTAAVYYTSDPLWDGNGCVEANNNCCANAGMPWFYRVFPNAQKDDIEVRICTNQVFADEAVAVDQLQLFVQ